MGHLDVELPDVGVSLPPPTVELKPMNADTDGEALLPLASWARLELLLPRMLPIPGTKASDTF
jgi:hypothetical protein